MTVSNDETVKRFLELGVRKRTLVGIAEKLEEETSNKAMIMFAQALDKDITDKFAGELAIVKSWVDEVTQEMNELSIEVTKIYLSPIVEKYLVDVDEVIANKIMELIAAEGM